MEIFLEFLKYGAIGIAMVLVVLSYRLLSKEQDKEHVREPMLKSIKSYIILALVLAAFFGITEIVSLMIAPEANNDGLKSKVEGVYERNLSDNNDTTIDDKLKSIELALRESLAPLKQDNCDSLKEENKLLLEEVKSAKYGIYVDVVFRLQDMVADAPGKFINLTHHREEKGEYYEMLGQILSFLDLIEEEEKNDNSRILEAWQAKKKTYAYLADKEKNRSDWIVKSDITQLLKLGHK